MNHSHERHVSRASVVANVFSAFIYVGGTVSVLIMLGLGFIDMGTARSSMDNIAGNLKPRGDA